MIPSNMSPIIRTIPVTFSVGLLVIAAYLHPAVAGDETVGGKSRKELMAAALDGADRLVVEPVPPMFGGEVRAERHEIEGREKIARLVAGLDFDEQRSGRICACYGEWKIKFQREGKVVGEFTLYHGEGLGWVGWKDMNNSIFTPEAGAHWREWFRKSGFNQFHEEHEAELKEEAEEQRIQNAFLSHFPEHARPLFIKRTADMYEDDDWITMKMSVREKLLADLWNAFEGEADLARALCAAFGELDGSGLGGWTSACPYMFLGQWAGEGLDPELFAGVIDGLSKPRDLLGAARLFFQEGVGQQLNDADRARLAARLGEVALRLALYHLGDRTMWPEGMFEIWSGLLGESGLVVLAKEGGRESLDRIIREATRHPHAAVREQAVLVVERLTGKRWYMGQEQERAEWHAEEIREWWTGERETWPDGAKFAKPNKAEHANPLPRPESKTDRTLKPAPL